MSKNRVKLVIWFVLILLTVALIYLTIVAIGRVVVYFGSGADRESALNLIPAVPPDLEDRVEWLPDHPDAAEGRVMDPLTRDQVAGGYLAAWAQLNISHELNRPYGLKSYLSGSALDRMTAAVEDVAASGWTMLQSDLHHTLQLSFYSDDGSIAALTDHDAEFVRMLTSANGRRVVLETSDSYDVVMLLEDGNWRVRALVRRGEGNGSLQTPAVSPAEESADLQLVTVEENHLALDGVRFVIAGVNYYPQETPWTLFWSEYDPDIIDADLAVVRSLGLNTVRIFVPFDEFGGGEPDPELLALLVDFLDRAETHAIKVIVTLFDHRTDHHPSNWAADQRHLAHVVPLLATRPALLAWDLKNEPDRDYEFNSAELTDGWLRAMAEQVRQLDRHHLITIGWSSPEAAAALADVVDLVSYHFFAPAEEYSARVAALRDRVGDRPLLLEEYGLPTWNSIFPNGHTETEQAVYYAAVLNQHRALETEGSVAWTLYDFTDVALGEFLMPWQSGPQGNMGLIRRDGSLKPSAALVAPGAALDVTPDPAWHRFRKPFWLLMFAGAFCFCGLVVVLFLLRRRISM